MPASGKSTAKQSSVVLFPLKQHTTENPMRITSEQIKVFETYAHRYFGEGAGLWLFGSRVDDRKKGGDYDFLVETTLSDTDEIIERKIALLLELQGTAQFEDEKIDIIVKRRNSTFDMPIYHAAMHEGVRI